MVGKIYGQWAGSKLWQASLGWGLGQQACARLHCCGGQAQFSLNPGIFKYSNTFQIIKYENVTLMAPKISKLGTVEDQFKQTNSLLGRSPNSQQNLN
jgi:hypothetical protein